MAIKRFTAEEQRLKKCERERLRRLNNPEKFKARDKAYNLANPEYRRNYNAAYLAIPEHAEAARKRARDYYYANKEKVKARNKVRYDSNKELVKKTNEAWRAKNMKRIAAAKRRKYHANPQYKLAVRVRARVTRALRGERAMQDCVAMLGCSLDELRSHIESLFRPGMSWDNWNFRGWHLDHVKPLVCFDLTDPKQLAQACHFTNLQPLWMKENLTKSRKPPRP